jgi:hypothetical protein
MIVNSRRHDHADELSAVTAPTHNPAAQGRDRHRPVTSPQ